MPYPRKLEEDQKEEAVAQKRTRHRTQVEAEYGGEEEKEEGGVVYKGEEVE